MSRKIISLSITEQNLERLDDVCEKTGLPRSNVLLLGFNKICNESPELFKVKENDIKN